MGGEGGPHPEVLRVYPYSVLRDHACSTWGAICDAKDHIRVSQIQSKYLTPYSTQALIPALKQWKYLKRKQGMI